jgi:predicted flap endonuclease-1-like 5' DNA nuclease
VSQFASLTRLGEEITSETDQRLAGVDGLISQTVADSLPGLAESVLSSARTEISAAVQAGVQESQALIEKRLGETEEVLRGDMALQVQDVQNSIAPAVQAEVDLQLPTRLATVRADVTALLERTTQIEATLLGHSAALDELRTQVDTRSGSASAARAELQQTLMAEMDSREGAIMGEMENRLTQAKATIGEQIDTAVADAQRAITTEAERIAGEAASTEARAVANQLRGEMHAVARDEIAAFQPQLRDLVSQEIGRATADVSALVKTEFEAFKPTIDEAVSRIFQDQGPALVEAELKKIAESRPELQPQADFTRIKGIGATFDLRLRAANVRTFADLAAMSAEAIAETLDTTAARVESYDIIGQAKHLAGIE